MATALKTTTVTLTLSEEEATILAMYLGKTVATSLGSCSDQLLSTYHALDNLLEGKVQQLNDNFTIDVVVGHVLRITKTTLQE